MATKLPSGNYRKQVYIGKDANGKRKYKSFTDCDPKRIEKEASAFAFDVSRNRVSEYEDMTLSEAVTKYIDGRKSFLSVSTIAGYRTIWRNDLGALANIKLNKITQIKIQEHIESLSRGNSNQKPLSAKTVSNVHGLISSTLNKYMPDMVLKTSLPKKTKKIKIVPSSQVLKQLFDDYSGADLEIALMLAACCSLRRSEICALTSDDVINNQIIVSKAMLYDENRNIVIQEHTKNYLDRTIDVPNFVLEKIKNKKGKLVKYTPDQLTEAIKTMKNKYKVKFSLHTLRAYFASFLHAQGIPDQYVAERGGWSDVSTLQNIYQKTMQENESDFNQIVMRKFTEAFDK